LSQKAKTLIAKLAATHKIGAEELSYIISQTDPIFWQKVREEADRVRQKYVGDAVHLRGLVEFSNYCRCNCCYCGLRRDNREVHRYRLEPEEIVQTALFAAELGYGTVVLQSGEDPYFSAEIIEQIILEIKKKTALAITLSVGERTEEDYTIWRQAGADRYLLRHETADPTLYSSLHPGRKLEERIGCLKSLHRLGFEVGSGFMVGLPGQGPDTLAADLLLLQKLDVDMLGIGPFIPSPQTPLDREAGGSFEQTVNMVALARLILPLANIPATTAMGTLSAEGREITLKAGANVVMPNVTPTKYRSLYQIYPGKICTGEEAGECRLCIEGRIKSIGRTVGQGQGESLKYLQRSANDGKHA
jgi:biotin synthase